MLIYSSYLSIHAYKAEIVLVLLRFREHGGLALLGKPQSTNELRFHPAVSRLQRCWGSLIFATKRGILHSLHHCSGARSLMWSFHQ